MVNIKSEYYRKTSPVDECTSAVGYTEGTFISQDFVQHYSGLRTYFQFFSFVKKCTVSTKFRRAESNSATHFKI